MAGLTAASYWVLMVLCSVRMSVARQQSEYTFNAVLGPLTRTNEGTWATASTFVSAISSMLNKTMSPAAWSPPGMAAS